MFEITGADIANLSDGDLRTLVARLALSELRAQGCPLSSVTAGGNQDAADGGLDVRVECPVPIARPDFVPRAFTGFQVKKPDMPANAIRAEMRPKGVLRPIIHELAAASGAYIIVSAQGSVADKPLADRRAAIRHQLHNLGTANQLHTDFYDRDRLATWVNEYPGIAAWVRDRVGRRLTGWSSIGNWTGTSVSGSGTYLFDDNACLTDERSRNREQLTISEGIALLREGLNLPRQCIRLIGLSGLGKTRLVQALFESGVGDAPLDPSLAIYTDYSVETIPAARDMARQLVMRGQRAILIVDNCNPATHSELASICSDSTSHVSLLTVEYDVRDDEPERTEVFRLQSGSSELVSKWLEQSFPNVSQVDRGTIADFSGGNFRVARAIAETLNKGETLGKLKSRALFERIFQQRNEPDQHLLLAAEDLSLLYSLDGEDMTDNGELARIATIRGVDARTLYMVLNSLRRRGIVQLRGRWRAILPHAIANPLAAYALERIPQVDLDRFCKSLTSRMRKSFSRRLGYLHDGAAARTAVVRWLSADGPFGNLIAQGDDGLEIITNIAPVAPEAVLEKLERELNGPSREMIRAANAAARWQWIRLIKMLGYDARMFERAAVLLARFVAAEPDGHNVNSARGAFAEFFHLYLSGTKALPDQRRMVIKRLAESGDGGQIRCASIALGALLQANHFSSSGNFDFGARSRDWGWRPEVNKDVWNWYIDAIHLAVELVSILPDTRSILANSVRELWTISACHDVLDQAAATFAKDNSWIKGWLAFRTVRRFDGKNMSDADRAKLDSIIQRLRPSDLLHQARAVILNHANGGWDIADGEIDGDDVMAAWNKASQLAQDIGRLFAQDPETRKLFLAELLTAPIQHRALECGQGLAEGAADASSIWQELVAQFASADPKKRNPVVLAGFIMQTSQRDAGFARLALDNVIDDGNLGRSLPYFQAHVGIDEEGISRLRRAIAKGVLRARDFRCIASGAVRESPAQGLGELLLDIAGLPDGVEIALDILHMRFHCDRSDGRPYDRLLIETGRDLLMRADFRKTDVLRDTGLGTVIGICCSGSDGVSTARHVCTHLYSVLEPTQFFSYDMPSVLKSLFNTQPFLALDIFLLQESSQRSRSLFGESFLFCTPIEDMDSAIVHQWAEIDAAVRYPLLGQAIALFRNKRGDDSNELTPLFIEMLDHASDKRAFLGDSWARVHPHSWSGSLAGVLSVRRAKLLELRERSHTEVRRWVDEFLPDLDRWIEKEQGRDREEEERFE